jgi:hypothetical protein
MLEFNCPTCGKRVQGDDALAGQSQRCPGCNSMMTVPGGDAAPVTSIAEGAYPAAPVFDPVPKDENAKGTPGVRINLFVIVFFVLSNFGLS